MVAGPPASRMVRKIVSWVSMLLAASVSTRYCGGTPKNSARALSCSAVASVSPPGPQRIQCRHGERQTASRGDGLDGVPRRQRGFCALMHDIEESVDPSCKLSGF